MPDLSFDLNFSRNSPTCWQRQKAKRLKRETYTPNPESLTISLPEKLPTFPTQKGQPLPYLLPDKLTYHFA